MSEAKCAAGLSMSYDTKRLDRFYQTPLSGGYHILFLPQRRTLESYQFKPNIPMFLSDCRLTLRSRPRRQLPTRSP